MLWHDRRTLWVTLGLFDQVLGFRKLSAEFGLRVAVFVGLLALERALPEFWLGFARIWFRLADFRHVFHEDYMLGHRITVCVCGTMDFVARIPWFLTSEPGCLAENIASFAGILRFLERCHLHVLGFSWKMMLFSRECQDFPWEMTSFSWDFSISCERHRLSPDKCYAFCGIFVISNEWLDFHNENLLQRVPVLRFEKA